MYPFSLLLVLASIFLSTVSSIPFSPNSQLQPRDYYPPNTTLVYQFPQNGSWIENLVERSSGDLLVIRADACQVYSIRPQTHTATLQADFNSAPFNANCTGALGITQISKDVFIVNTGIYNLAKLQITPGSFVLWKLDYSGCQSEDNLPTVTKLATIADSKFIDGITTWSPDVVLAGDMFIGGIFAVDVRTGSYSLPIQDPTMAPVSGGLAVPIGINGLKVLRNESHAWIYYTNTAREMFYRIPVSLDDIPQAIGAPEVLAKNITADDFALLVDGRAYIAGNAEPVVWDVSPTDQVSVAIGGAGQDVVLGSTAALFGKTEWDKGTLYVSTSGGGVEAGKVVAVKLDCKEWEECVNSEWELNA